MKKIISIFTVIFIFSGIFAQTPTIESICQKLAVHPVTKGDFLQVKKINSAKGVRELKSNGEFIFSLDGIMWKTLKPFPTTMIIGTNFISQVAADGSKKVTDTSDNPVFANVASTIVAVFSNDSTKLQNSFNVNVSNEKGNLWYVELKPKDQTIASVIKEIDMFVLVDENEATLCQLFMAEASDNSTHYFFSNSTYPKELTDDEKNFFVFK